MVRKRNLLLLGLLGLGIVGLVGIGKRAWAQNAVEKRFDQLDRDRNGKVTPEELPTAELFKRLDLDANGEITKAEATRALARGNLKDLLKPNRTGGDNPATVKQIEAIAKQADNNGDGKITRDEAGDAPWFERADRNGDDVVDRDEVEAIKKSVAAIGNRSRGAESLLAPAVSVTESDLERITSGPTLRQPSEAGIGRMIADIEFSDRAGHKHHLRELALPNGIVLAMTSATCPVSKRYLPALAQLQQQLQKSGVNLVLINPFGSEKPAAIDEQLRAHSYTGVYVHDKNKNLSLALQALTTTEVFLLDSRCTLIYRGALDDQYGINYNLDAPKHRYLLDAVDALLQKRSPKVQATAAPGCELDLGQQRTDSRTTITYHRDVARILRQNCVTCHRDGGIAPFALDELDAVLDHAKVIKRVVAEKTMPPWFAAKSGNAEATPWANDCSLAERDKTDLLAWIDSRSRPLGDPADAPLAQTWPKEWSIGTPDLVLPLSRAYDIKATGFMRYQFDVVETKLTEDKWVTAYEILPSERDVVHHVIVTVHEPGTAVRDRGEGASGYWAAYVPGNSAREYPAGFARRLPAGAKVSFQIHYTPSGMAKKERLKMGLVFAKQPPAYEVRTVGIAHPGISIPAQAANHVETKARRVPFDMPITAFMAHMHVRGKAFQYAVTYPDGRREVLLDIPRYDFNWQLCYNLKQPRLVPQGSTLTVRAVFDNSASNAANPDPNKVVKWGQQTVDEMLIGYVEYFVPLGQQTARR